MSPLRTGLNSNHVATGIASATMLHIQLHKAVKVKALARQHCNTLRRADHVHVSEHALRSILSVLGPLHRLYSFGRAPVASAGSHAPEFSTFGPVSYEDTKSNHVNSMMKRPSYRTASQQRLLRLSVQVPICALDREPLTC
jgi:hypothetical protein